MRSVSSCLVCGGAINEKPARVAPFLAYRIWKRDSFAATLNACPSCGFEFFNPRLTEDEEALLYADYRSPTYQAERQSFEPWYTETYNRCLGANEAELSARAALISLLIAGRGIQSVLDFGGDMGQLVVRLPVRNKFVFDISGVPTVPGVSGFKTLAECSTYDLITCAHVLEHVGDPLSIMGQIAGVSRPGTLVYLEVPNERFHANRIKSLFHLLRSGIRALRNPRAFLAKLKLGALCVMHEHVSVFNDASLRRLAERAGFRVVCSSTDMASGAKALDHVFWCLAACS